jgi:hypothetical protein
MIFRIAGEQKSHNLRGLLSSRIGVDKLVKWPAYGLDLLTIRLLTLKDDLVPLLESDLGFSVDCC